MERKTVSQPDETGADGESKLSHTEKRLYAVERQLERQIQRLTALNRFALEVAGAIRPVAIARAATDVLLETFALDFVIVLMPEQTDEPACRVVRFPREGIDRVERAPPTAWLTAFTPAAPVLWEAAPPPAEVLGEVDRLLEEACGGNCEELACDPVVALVPLGPAGQSSARGALLAVRALPAQQDAETVPGAEDALFLGLLGRHVGAALERAGLYRELEARVSERTAALAAAQSALDSEVAERQNAERRLRLAERMESVGRLALGVGHEINNPLSYIWFNLEFVRDLLRELEPVLGAARVEELTAPLEEALGGANRIRRIVEDLRVFGRDDKPRDQVVCVHDVLRLAVKLVMAEIKPRAQVREDFRSTLRVRADGGRLEQVFVNLLVNAAQAMPEGHAGENQIRITTRDEGERVAIEVADTGPGIPPEDLDRVFDPFFTTKPVGKGSGLGLSLCHGIVTGMGGTIRIESELGHGTRVLVSLPASLDEGATDPRQSSSDLEALVPREVAAGTRVLLVDDEPLVRRSMARLLQDFDVTTAASGRQAIELLSGQTFDVIVCDLMMGDLTGMDVYEAVARRAPALRQRVVFITGGAFTEGARAFLQSIGNRTLKKPVSRKELHAAISAVLG